MKASLGAPKYKQLKRYTKEFASGDLRPDAYVDHCAALFAAGYGDADFWDFVPALLMSFPNQADARRAMDYMENLKRMQNGARNAESTTSARMVSTTASSPSGGWNAAPELVPEPATMAPPSSSSSRWTSEPYAVNPITAETFVARVCGASAPTRRR